MGSIPRLQCYFFIEDFGSTHATENKRADGIYLIDDLRNADSIERGIDQVQKWGRFDHIIATNEYTCSQSWAGGCSL